MPWSSKKQPLIARSSVEAGHRVLAHTTSIVLWVYSIINELVVSFHSPTLLCYSLNSMLLSHNPILHARTKHIELDIHFVLITKRVKIEHIPSSVQVTDIITKSFSTSSFQNLLTQLKVTTYIPPWSCGGVLEE